MGAGLLILLSLLLFYLRKSLFGQEIKKTKLGKMRKKGEEVISSHNEYPLCVLYVKSRQHFFHKMTYYGSIKYTLI